MEIWQMNGIKYQKSLFLMMGKMSSRTYLSLMNMAFACFGSVLYWKYWHRQKSLVWMTICLSLRSIWMSFIVAPGSYILYVTSWQQLDDGSLPLRPKNTSSVPTFWRQRDQKLGCFLGSCLMTGRSATSYSLQIQCSGFTLGLVCSITASSGFLALGWYFSPIFASILALGLATSFFQLSAPIAPGLSMLPLYGFSTMSGSSSPAMRSLRAISEPQSNIQ